MAALFALARVAGDHSNQGSDRLTERAEGCFREAIFSASGSPATTLLGFLRQPFPEMQISAFRCAYCVPSNFWKIGHSLVGRKLFIVYLHLSSTVKEGSFVSLQFCSLIAHLQQAYSSVAISARFEENAN